MAKSLCFLVLFLALLPQAGSSLAQTIKVSFEAVITEIDDPYGYAPPTWAVGDTVPGSYQYELGALDVSPDPTEGKYLYSAPPNGLWVGAKGYVYMTDTTLVDVRLTVNNDLAGGGVVWDRYQLHSQNNLLEPEVLGVGASAIIVEMYDSTGTALGNDSLPASAPDLGAWTYSRRLGIFGEVTYRILLDFVSFSDETATGIDDVAAPDYVLRQNSPNPFSSRTTISFALGDVSSVRLGIYDVSGRLVDKLHQSSLPPGNYSFVWHGRGAGGRKLASGVYFCVLSVDGRRETRRLVLLK